MPLWRKCQSKAERRKKKGWQLSVLCFFGFFLCLLSPSLHSSLCLPLSLHAVLLIEIKWWNGQTQSIFFWSDNFRFRKQRKQTAKLFNFFVAVILSKPQLSLFKRKKTDNDDDDLRKKKRRKEKKVEAKFYGSYWFICKKKTILTLLV